MKTYKIQEIKGRYFVTLPLEIIKRLGLDKSDLLEFSVIQDEKEQPAIIIKRIFKEQQGGNQDGIIQQSN